MKYERRVRWFMVAMFAVTAAVFIGEGAAFKQTHQDYVDTVDQVDRITERIRISRRVYLDLLNAETGQRGFLLTNNPAYLQPFEHGISQLSDDLNAFRQTQPARRAALVAEVEQLSQAKVDELRKTIALLQVEGFSAAQAVVHADEGRIYMEGIRTILESVIIEDEQQRTELNSGMGDSIKSSSLSWRIGSAAVLIALTLGTIGFWRVSARNARLNDRLYHESKHDSLTDLPNRSYFRQTLDYMLAVAKRERLRTAVLYLDLDGFKAINDEMGHDKGDVALVEVANTLRELMRESDFVARLGGDEFAILVPTADGDLIPMCQRIQAAIQALTPPALEGRRLGASVGVAMYPQDGDTADRLLEVADQRMFERKRATKAHAQHRGAPVAAHG